MRQGLPGSIASAHSLQLPTPMESRMPHQDKHDLRTPLAELKESLAPLGQAQLGNVSRHGNATVGGLAVATLALLTFGWSRQKTLGERFDAAHQAAQRVLGGVAIAGSYQALMVDGRCDGRCHPSIDCDWSCQSSAAGS